MIELRRFCPSLRAVKLHSSDQEERKRLMQTLAHQTGDVDVVVGYSGLDKVVQVQGLRAGRVLGLLTKAP